MELPTLNKTDFENLFNKKGEKQGNAILESIAKQNKFVKAFSSDIGQELLKDASARLEELFNKIVQETSTEVERAEFRAFKVILERWLKRIDIYIENIEYIKKI